MEICQICLLQMLVNYFLIPQLQEKLHLMMALIMQRAQVTT